MRYFRIFLLHFQQAFENRGRSLVWFLLALIGPLIGMAYWIAVYRSENHSIVGWSLPTVTSYYFLLIIAGSFLIAHNEEDVAVNDIQEGQLSTYLIRPFSYFLNQLVGEISWRLLQGVFSVIIIIVLTRFFGSFFTITNDPVVFMLAFISLLLGFVLSFIFKMLLGISAFWFTDFRGIQNISEIVLLVLAGFIMPLDFFPHGLHVLSNLLPFAYMVYYPLTILEGKYELQNSIMYLLLQVGWILVLGILYKVLWKMGIEGYTGAGQ